MKASSTQTIENRISSKKERKERSHERKEGRESQGESQVLVKAEPWGCFRTNF